jgi:branched-subunit amino acid transport protein
MRGNVYIYILVMAGVTYLIRLLPLLLFSREIKNIYIKSFLYYVPYVTLAVMIFPGILYATENIWSALTGFLTALILAYMGKNLFVVSLCACLSIFIVELLQGFIF